MGLQPTLGRRSARRRAQAVSAVGTAPVVISGRPHPSGSACASQQVRGDFPSSGAELYRGHGSMFPATFEVNVLAKVLATASPPTLTTHPHQGLGCPPHARPLPCSRSPRSVPPDLCYHSILTPFIKL